METHLLFIHMYIFTPRHTNTCTHTGFAHTDKPALHIHVYTHILMTHSYMCLHTSLAPVCTQIGSLMQTLLLPAHLFWNA